MITSMMSTYLLPVKIAAQVSILATREHPNDHLRVFNMRMGNIKSHKTLMINKTEREEIR